MAFYVWNFCLFLDEENSKVGGLNLFGNLEIWDVMEFIFTFWFGTKERREWRKRGCSFVGLGFLAESFFSIWNVVQSSSFHVWKWCSILGGERRVLRRKNWKEVHNFYLYCVFFLLTSIFFIILRFGKRKIRKMSKFRVCNLVDLRFLVGKKKIQIWNMLRLSKVGKEYWKVEDIMWFNLGYLLQKISI